MPIFRRPDGELVPGLSPLRRIMPHLLPTRNGSCVYYQQELDLGRTLPFIEEWNQTHADRLTVFELIVAACGQVLHARSGLNRFVSGGRIYQRHGVQISFAVKQRFEEGAPTSMVKLEMRAGEPLIEMIRRMRASIDESRADEERGIDRELRWVTALPTALLTGAVGLISRLNTWNLMPPMMMRGDPMFASMFLANLGSLGIDRAFHHLYEYGTGSIFGAVGAIKKVARLASMGVPSGRDAIDVCWTFDERINDGFYCAAALELLRRLVEDPAAFVQGGREPCRVDPGWALHRDAR